LDRDRQGAAAVVVIGESVARRLWPGGDAIGQRIVLGAALGGDRTPREIVGVVRDVRSANVETSPPMQLYVPYAQTGWPTMSVAVRAAGDPARLPEAIRTQVLSLDADQAVYAVRSLTEVVDRALAARRFQMSAVAMFAIVGLALVATGIYSVVAYTVRQRSREIGVRMALGAQRHHVMLLAVRDTLGCAAAGILAGATLAVLAGGLLGGALFGVTPTDPLTFAAVLGGTAVVAAAGSGLAGWRAVRTDPLVTLRQS
jgi:putative ABC transport system permease protein